MKTFAVIALFLGIIGSMATALPVFHPSLARINSRAA